ncbi:helicase BlpT [Streptococcus caprae]|uniref:Helicase BlpT n=1 Tax=Streptococcus caprae TaxID=1640501 RepID=A0ABV8CY53_9STRE
MTDTIDILAQAKALLTTMQEAFEQNPTETQDQLRVQTYLKTTLADLNKAKKVDNTVLIALEKFYKSICVLKGLSHLTFDDQTEVAWRAYDRFHTDVVQKELSLYGWTATI